MGIRHINVVYRHREKFVNDDRENAPLFCVLDISARARRTSVQRKQWVINGMQRRWPNRDKKRESVRTRLV